MLNEIRFQSVLVDKDSLRDWLTQVSATAGELAIAVGYLSPDGLAALLSSIGGMLPNIDRIRIIAGNLDSATNPENVAGIRQKLRDLGNKLEIRHYSVPFGLFHPKMYLARDPNGWQASTGSSNLTTSALHRNVELDVTTRAPDGNVYAQKFDEWWVNARTVSIDSWPLSPRFEAMLHQAMQAGRLVRITTYLDKAIAPIRVPDSSAEPFRGEQLRLVRNWEGQAFIVRKEKLDEVRNAANRIQRNLRAISLRTPWNARFVPAALRQELAELLQREEEPLQRLVYEACTAVEELDAFLLQVGTQVDQAFEPVESEKRAAMKSEILRLAAKRHNEFLHTHPRPLEVRIEFCRTPQPGSYAPAFTDDDQRRIEEADRREWSDWLITIATAPRRSLRKFGNPARARALCLLPDAHLDTIIRTAQEPLFNQASPPAAQQIEDQIRVMNSSRNQGPDTLKKTVAEFLGIDD